MVILASLLTPESITGKGLKLSTYAGDSCVEKQLLGFIYSSCNYTNLPSKPS